MPREELPITPALITWARERAGFTMQQAAQTFQRIEDWEAGNSYPTYPQLEQLAKTFKLPVAVFFFPEPPDVPPIDETFRTLPETEFEQLPSKIRLLLRKAKALQLNLAELTNGRNPAKRLVIRDLVFSPTVEVNEMAVDVRDHLGVSLQDQQAWPDDESALRVWRQALLDVGIYVFKDAFRLDEYSGFCLYDDVFPIIYVNNSVSKTRQIFTLFHELAHLLFRTSGIDTIHDAFIPGLNQDSQRIEILCNRFAAEFLVPELEFNVALRGRDPSEATAENLAALFHVSREVIYRRFLDRGLIGEQQYSEAAARWAAQRQPGGPGGDYYWTKLAYLGRDYVALALGQYHQNRIDEYQLADYLDMKPRNITGIEEYFSRGGV